MAENDQAPEGTVTRAADWEVVSLTASTYAAAPGPGGEQKPPECHDDPRSSALLTSDLFVFPPSEHENLPIKTKFGDDNEGGDQDDDIVIQNLKSNANADAHNIQYYSEGKNLSAQELESMDEDAVEDDEVGDDDDQEDDGEDDDGEDDDDGNGNEDDYGHRTAKYIDLGNDGAPTNFPHILWWKRHATHCYLQAKQSNAFWPMVVAAALVGLVILGNKLHQNKWQLRKLKGQ